MKTVVILLLSLISALTDAQATRFHVIREWKSLNFTWPNRVVYKTAQENGMYIPENNIIAGVKYYGDHYYLTLPRMKKGVPATLARISSSPAPEQQPSPALEPFPSWQMNTVGDCNALQNVQNIEIDPKGQIWIIDGGRVATLDNPVVKCPPKLVVFDIEANRTSTVHDFPEEIAPKNGSFLYDLVVDNTDGGFVYITDNSANDPGIIVFSVRENRSWKIRHAQSMRADPTATQFNVNGIHISAPINIAGIALGPKIHTSNQNVVVNEDREVFFSPLSSKHLYSINTTILRNENMAKNPQTQYDQHIKNIGMKQSQTVGMIMDNQGILYYGLLSDGAIAKWDSHMPFNIGQKLIGQDEKYIEWPMSFTFDPVGNLTVVTNRLDKFIFDKLNANEANFRLLSAHVGGKSYLHDENYDYHSVNEPTPEPEPSSQGHSSTSSTSSSSTSSSSTSSQSISYQRQTTPSSRAELPTPDPSAATKSVIGITTFAIFVFSLFV